MKKLLITFAIVLFVSTICLGKNSLIKQNDDAKTLVEEALEAMGGSENIRSLSSIKFEGIGHNFSVEQSERPEGPFLVAYQQLEEIRDLQNNYLHRNMKMRQFQMPDWVDVTLIVADGFAAYKRGERIGPGRIIEVEDATLKLALAPEKILLTALAASDLRLDKSNIVHNVKQNMIKFTIENVPVTVYLNSHTNLLTAVETVSSSTDDFFWSIWGDVTTRTFYSLWKLEPGGIRYPYQQDTVRNDYPLESFTITNLKLNEPVEANLFEIPDETKKMFAAVKTPDVNEIPLGIKNRPASEIVPGIVEIPGAWDVAFVRQTDGIVILEAPISSGYSAKAITEAKKRFPNVRIKGIITTSDAFPHIGGIREYVAQEIPIYALDLNKTILQRIINSPRKLDPDNLERNSKNPDFNFVSQKTTTGKGDNRLEIYPFHTESGERMMMIYFPGHKILYTSDLIQRSRQGGFFMPQYLSEVMEAVNRENLKVESVFGMHLSITPWSEIVEAVYEHKKKPAN